LLAEPAPDLFLKAADICSQLWGGIYNPIVILNQVGRARLGMQERFGHPAEKETLNTIKDFDPDFLVTLGTDALPPYLDRLLKDRHLKEQALTQELRPGQRSGVFLEVWPFLHEFWKHEIREATGDAGVRLVYAPEGNAWESFVAAQFGRYQREGITRTMHEQLSAQDSLFDVSFRQAFEYGQFWFPIDFTALSIDTLGHAASVNTAVFLLDPENIFDVVDFWNLRAAGMTIFPLPASAYRDYAKGVRAFATATKLNMPMHYDGEVIKARSISDELLEEVSKWASDISRLRITRRGWYPRFGTKMELMSPDITPVPSGDS
jgi:hypothetical protein